VVDRTESEKSGLLLLLMPVVVILVLALALGFYLRGKQDALVVETAPIVFETVENSVGMSFVEIPSGQFVMGQTGLAEPERSVRVASFFMATHEVTQAQWYAVMGYNPSEYKDPRRPVDKVTWLEIQGFIQGLNELEGSGSYRLPTEAEWEYAARAGTEGGYFFDDTDSALGEYAWFGANDRLGTRPVGSLKPNPWGLYDIYGNVWEWVQDCWHDNYDGAPATAEVFAGGDCAFRVLRGGGWNASPRSVGSAVRGSYEVNFEDISNGFRLVWTK